MAFLSDEDSISAMGIFNRTQKTTLDNPTILHRMNEIFPVRMITANPFIYIVLSWRTSMYHQKIFRNQLYIELLD